MYLPFIGLLLITVELVRRWRVNAAVLGVVLAVAGFLTWQRAHVWSSALALWTDTVERSPRNVRAVFQLAYAQWRNGQCARASETYGRAAALQPPDDRLLIDWALALDCENKPDEAVAKLRQAIGVNRSALAYAQIGMVYGKRGRNAEALAAIDEALRIDPAFDMAYVYRGNILLMQGDRAAAVAMYEKAIALNPGNTAAREALFKATNPR
jgi:tetratricopeptide (TPR) repeat protein